MTCFGKLEKNNKNSKSEWSEPIVDYKIIDW